jgi:hypothetical protein
LRKTRQSLFYTATYLYLGGAAFVAFPKLALVLFLSSGDYSDLMVRMAGTLLLGLAIIVTQIIRHRVTILYPTTLVVRALFLFAFANFFYIYHDPMMLVLMGIVGLGVILTLSGLFLDRRDKMTWPTS